MKIISCHSYVLKVPLGDERFYSSQCAFPERTSLLVKVVTDEGIIGWGEGGQYGPPEPVAACIDSVLVHYLIGEDPRNVVRIWEKLYTSVRDFGFQGPYIEAISAIDIALWDISGKYYGVPVYKILGGAFRDSVDAYATGGYYKESDMEPTTNMLNRMEKEVQGFVDTGFRVAKVKIGLLETKWDFERLKITSNIIGDDGIVLTDANHAYNASTIIHLGHQMEELNIGWIEEPVVPENLDGYNQVRKSISIPIAGGECTHTRFGFRELISRQCVDIAQPDVCVAGGISEFVKILAVALSYNIRVIPHVWGSGVAIAAALQMCAIIPPEPHTANRITLQNEPIIEFDRSPNPLRDDLIEGKISLVNGKLPIPDKAGLGITVKEDVLKKYQSL